MRSCRARTRSQPVPYRTRRGLENARLSAQDVLDEPRLALVAQSHYRHRQMLETFRELRTGLLDQPSHAIEPDGARVVVETQHRLALTSCFDMHVGDSGFGLQ